MRLFCGDERTSFVEQMEVLPQQIFPQKSPTYIYIYIHLCIDICICIYTYIYNIYLYIYTYVGLFCGNIGCGKTVTEGAPTDVCTYAGLFCGYVGLFAGM